MECILIIIMSWIIVLGCRQFFVSYVYKEGANLSTVNFMTGVLLIMYTIITILVY